MLKEINKQINKQTIFNMVIILYASNLTIYGHIVLLPTLFIRYRCKLKNTATYLYKSCFMIVVSITVIIVISVVVVVVITVTVAVTVSVTVMITAVKVSNS